MNFVNVDSRIAARMMAQRLGVQLAEHRPAPTMTLTLDELRTRLGELTTLQRKLVDTLRLSLARNKGGLARFARGHLDPDRLLALNLSENQRVMAEGLASTSWQVDSLKQLVKRAEAAR